MLCQLEYVRELGGRVHVDALMVRGAGLTVSSKAGARMDWTVGGSGRVSVGFRHCRLMKDFLYVQCQLECGRELGRRMHVVALMIRGASLVVLSKAGVRMDGNVAGRVGVVGRVMRDCL